MALNVSLNPVHVYVMPLWQFKASFPSKVGTGTEEIFYDDSATTVQAGIFNLSRIKRYFIRRQADRERRAIISEAEKKLGTRLMWTDSGSVVYEQQVPSGFEALRAFTKWLDLRDQFPTFDEPPHGNFYEHPVLSWAEQPLTFRFQHIFEHTCSMGYYVPCRFFPIIRVEPYTAWRGKTLYHTLGSSFTLADQIQSLQPFLPPLNQEVEYISTTCSELVNMQFEILRELSEISTNCGLPIAFLEIPYGAI